MQYLPKKLKKEYENPVHGFKSTCKQIASCLPDTKFVETRYGGYFEKGKRKIGAVVSRNQKDDYDSSLRINKWKNGFGLNVHPSMVFDYYSLKDSVKRGLGIKN